MRLRKAMLGLTLAVLLAMPAMADMSDLSNITGGGETLLYTVYNTIYGTGLTSNAELVSTYGLNGLETLGAGDYGVEALWMDAYYNEDLSGYYTDGSGTFDILLGGLSVIDNTWRIQHFTNGTGPVGLLQGLGLTGWFTATSEIGFANATVDQSNGNTLFDFYSESALNIPGFGLASGDSHFLFFETPTHAVDGSYFIAIEDLPIDIANLTGTDYSHGDFNDFVFELKPVIIPEPSSMLLLGMGIAGMAIRRFRKAKA